MTENIFARASRKNFSAVPRSAVAAAEAAVVAVAEGIGNGPTLKHSIVKLLVTKEV